MHRCVIKTERGIAKENKECKKLNTERKALRKFNT